MAKDNLDSSCSMGTLFGTHLRRLRLHAGLTQEEVGTRVHVVASRIAQLERASGHKPTLRLTRALDELLNADGLLTDLLPHVLREAFPDWSRRFMDLSQRAVNIQQYTAQSVPGLLQTEEYARAVLRVGLTLRDPVQLEERVTARLSRQERLNAVDRPELTVILDEAALRRPMGGVRVMRDQLTHLLRAAKAPLTTLQVLPFSSGEHPSLGGSLTLLILPDGSRAAYREGAHHGQLIEDPDEVTSFVESYHQLRAAALPPSMSIAFARSVLEDSFRDPRVPTRSRRRRLAQVQLQQSGGGQLRGGRRRLAQVQLQQSGRG